MIRKVTLMVATFLLAGALVAHRPAAADDDVTLQGEIVDMACYIGKGLKGSAHKSCAQLCAKKGVPLGILTDGGELYLLLDDHNDPDPYDAAKKLAGEKAEVVGKKYNKQGVAGIVVSGAKAL